MTESEVIALIRRVVSQEFSPIVIGQTVSNESDTMSTVQRYPVEPPRAGTRTVMPFGFASKPPANMQTCIVPIGNDPSNQITLGQFDPNRPPLNDGDVAFYDGHGNVIYLSNGKLQFGSEGSSQNMVLGLELKALLEQLLDALAQHTHAGIGVPPTNAQTFEQLKMSPVDDNKILSQKAYLE